MSARLAIARPLKSLLHGASDRAYALFNQRRRLADVTDGLTAIIEDAYVPLQPLLGLGARRRLALPVLVRSFLNGLVLRADTIGHGALLAAKSLETAKNLRALLRQILEGRGESAQKLRVRVGAGLRLEVRDGLLHVGDRNPPLRHFGRQIRNIAFVPPALRVQIELWPGPDGGKRKGRRLDLLTGPIGIGFHAGLSDRPRRQYDQNRNRENGAKRSMHTRFPLSSMIGLPLPPIKPPRITDASLNASPGVSEHARDGLAGDRGDWDAT